MKKTKTPEGLKDTTEHLRRQKFPGIPKDLVSSILAEEEACLDDQVEAYKRVETLISQTLNGRDK